MLLKKPLKGSAKDIEIQEALRDEGMEIQEATKRGTGHTAYRRHNI